MKNFCKVKYKEKIPQVAQSRIHVKSEITSQKVFKILVHCSCSVGKLFLLIILICKYTKVLRKTTKAVKVLKITNETFVY